MRRPIISPFWRQSAAASDCSTTTAMGKLDVFLTGGGGFAGTGQSKHQLGRPCKLYRNLGGWEVQGRDRGSGSGGLSLGHLSTRMEQRLQISTAMAGPISLVTGWGRARPVPQSAGRSRRSPKKGRKFVDVTVEGGIEGHIVDHQRPLWADFDGDGYPDVYLCQYVDWSFDYNPPSFAS